MLLADYLPLQPSAGGADVIGFEARYLASTAFGNAPPRSVSFPNVYGFELGVIWLLASLPGSPR